MNQSDLMAPDASEVERLALATRDALPDVFRGAAEAVVLRVEEFAADDMLSELGIEDPFSLTGLYDGIPMTEKSVADQPERPDMIWLFRRAILDEWIARGDVSLGALVGHVYVHELAHHFGWSDEDIAAIDEWWT
ncbi:MAG: metallopeptidase family protein [Pseudomonadota bacterium]